MAIENKMIANIIRYKLLNTKVLLFKAILEDTRFKTRHTTKLFKYVYKLPYNNVDKILNHTSQIKVINMHQINHGNILSHEDLLIKNLLFWIKDESTEWSE